MPLGGPVRGEIDVRGLTFRYAPDRSPALRDLSLRVEAGGSVAIVGPTGSGKSTLGALLPRIWDPPPGTIFIDGREIHTIPLGELRAAIGFVPQEAFLFSRTLRENVAFGEPEAGVAAAAEVASLSPDVAQLPGGWETLVGERALTLSGGQRQRRDPGPRPVARSPDPHPRRRLRGSRRGDRGHHPRATSRAHPGAHDARDHPPPSRSRQGSIASSSWTTGRSRRKAPTPSSWPGQASTPGCGGVSSSNRPSRRPDEVGLGPGTAGRARRPPLGGRRRRRPRLRFAGSPAVSGPTPAPTAAPSSSRPRLFPLLAAVDLVQPYLVKVAIDADILRGDWPGLSRIVGLFFLTLGGPVRAPLRADLFRDVDRPACRSRFPGRALRPRPAAARRLLRPYSRRPRDDADPRRRRGDRRGLHGRRRRDPGRRHHPRRSGRRDARASISGSP